MQTLLHKLTSHNWRAMQRLFAHENLPIKTAVFFLSLGKLVEI